MLASVLNDHLPGAGPVPISLAVAVIVLARYLVFAGGALVATLLFRRHLASRRIQPVPFTSEQMRREFLNSLSSVVVFALVGLAVFRLNEAFGILALYKQPDQYGGFWFWLSIPVALLVHDFYFYWAHRFMHLPGVFERVHKVHHLSTNPSPLAAFAFHPLEAVVEAMGFVLILVVVPMHPLAFLIVSTLMIVINVIGHLGYEIYPKALLSLPGGKFANTATSHNQHHRTFNYNYGLYTLMWDRLFGTLHRRYEDTYASVTGNARTPTEIPSSQKGTY
jgi:sterol desaturase/sphingolipid hydroxylase (fatty acid hydroxylase superfamily)